MMGDIWPPASKFIMEQRDLYIMRSSAFTHWFVVYIAKRSFDCVICHIISWCSGSLFYYVKEWTMQKDRKVQTYLQVKAVVFKLHRCPHGLMHLTSTCSITLLVQFLLELLNKKLENGLDAFLTHTKENLEGFPKLRSMFLVCLRKKHEPQEEEWREPLNCSSEKLRLRSCSHI